MNTGCGCTGTIEQIGQLKISTTARYVATVMEMQRIGSTKELAALTGVPLRSVQRALKEYRDAIGGGAISGAVTPPVARDATSDAPSVAPNAISGATSRVHARAQIELPSEVVIPEEVKQDPPTPQRTIDDETSIEFHRICTAWGQKPGAVLFGGLSIEDTDRQLAGEVRGMAAQHPDAPQRILNAALLTAMNALRAKSLERHDGPSRGRGCGSAAAYLRKAYSSEIGRMLRDDANDEAHRRADLHVHTTKLERRLAAPAPRSTGGGWAAAMAELEARG